MKKASWTAAAVVVFLVPSLFSVAAFEKPPADGSVFQNPESLIRGLYGAFSFDPGPGPDWEFVKKFFHPQAVCGVRKTAASMEMLSLGQFVDWFVDYVERYKMKETGFEEMIAKLKMTSFGDTAQAFVVYKLRTKKAPDAILEYGLDSWLLMKKDGRWWVAGMTNEVLGAGMALPEELRVDGK